MAEAEQKQHSRDGNAERRGEKRNKPASSLLRQSGDFPRLVGVTEQQRACAHAQHVMGLSAIKCHKVENMNCNCRKSSWIRLEQYWSTSFNVAWTQKQPEAHWVAAKMSLDKLPGEYVYLLEKVVVVESPSSARF